MAKIKEGFKGSQMVVLPISKVEEMERDAFASALHMTDIGYFPHAQYHYRRREKGVPQYILIYCRDGKGWIECRGRRYQLNADQFMIIPAGVPHAYGADNDNPWSIYWLHFKGTQAAYYGDGFGTPQTISADLEGARIIDRINIFEEIYQTLELGYGREQLHYAISALHHFLGSFKFADNFRQADSQISQDKDIIERCRRFLLDNIERKITLAQICDHLGYSPSYCSVVFRKYTGMPPIQYLLHLRIQTACKLLDLTDMKINQVCFKVGIDDPYYFSRIFSKIIGISPMEYRQHKKN